MKRVRKNMVQQASPLNACLKETPISWIVGSCGGCVGFSKQWEVWVRTQEVHSRKLQSHESRWKPIQSLQAQPGAATHDMRESKHRKQVSNLNGGGGGTSLWTREINGKQYHREEFSLLFYLEWSFLSSIKRPVLTYGTRVYMCSWYVV